MAKLSKRPSKAKGKKPAARTKAKKRPAKTKVRKPAAKMKAKKRTAKPKMREAAARTKAKKPAVKPKVRKPAAKMRAKKALAKRASAPSAAEPMELLSAAIAVETVDFLARVITVAFPRPGANDCGDPLVAFGNLSPGATITGAHVAFDGGEDIPGTPGSTVPPSWSYSFPNVPCGVPLALVLDGTDAQGNPVQVVTSFQCTCPPPGPGPGPGPIPLPGQLLFGS